MERGPETETSGQKSGRQENTRGPTATREGGPAPPATPTRPLRSRHRSRSRDPPPHHRRGPSTRRDTWPPDAKQATHHLGPGDEPTTRGGLLRSREPLTHRPQRNAPRGSRRPRPGPHAHRPLAGCGSGRERAASHSRSGRGGTGQVPTPSTRDRSPAAQTHAAPRAHTTGPPRQTAPARPSPARPGPAGPSPDSEGGGAGRGRRKSRRTAPTRGGTGGPLPSPPSSTQGGQRGRARTLAYCQARRQRAQGRGGRRGIRYPTRGTPFTDR